VIDHKEEATKYLKWEEETNQMIFPKNSPTFPHPGYGNRQLFNSPLRSVSETFLLDEGAKAPIL